MEKGFKINLKFDIKSNSKFPGANGNYEIESADSVVEVMAELPATIKNVSKVIMDTYFECQERQRSIRENALLKEALDKNLVLENKVIELEQRIKKLVMSKVNSME